MLLAEGDAGGSGRMDLAAAGLEPRGLWRGATEVLAPVLGGRDCGCWGDITGVPVCGEGSKELFHCEQPCILTVQICLFLTAVERSWGVF